MSDSLSVKGARNSSCASYGKMCAKNGANICSSRLKWALCFLNQLFTYPCKCVCVCVWVKVWNTSECVFWRVYSCIEPVEVHLKLVICNVPFLQRGLPRHKDLIYWFMLALVSTVILLFHLCAAIFAVIIISHIALCLISRLPPPPLARQLPRPVINAMFL